MSLRVAVVLDQHPREHLHGLALFGSILDAFPGDEVDQISLTDDALYTTASWGSGNSTFFSFVFTMLFLDYRRLSSKGHRSAMYFSAASRTTHARHLIPRGNTLEALVNIRRKTDRRANGRRALRLHLFPISLRALHPTCL
jgi:hypothetical protein